MSKVKVIKNEIVCGIDPSPNKTAIMVFHNGILARKYFTTKTKKHLAMDRGAVLLDPKIISDLDKLVLIEELIADIITNVKPHYVAIEDFSLGSTHQTYPVGGNQYLIRLLFYKAGIPLRFYRPDKVKKFASGNGHADKNVMLAKCFMKWGADFTDYGENAEDLADAFCIGRLLISELKLKSGKIKREDLLKYEEEVFYKPTDKNPIPLIEQPFIMKT